MQLFKKVLSLALVSTFLSIAQAQDENIIKDLPEKAIVKYDYIDGKLYINGKEEIRYHNCKVESLSAFLKQSEKTYKAMIDDENRAYARYVDYNEILFSTPLPLDGYDYLYNIGYGESHTFGNAKRHMLSYEFMFSSSLEGQARKKIFQAFYQELNTQAQQLKRDKECKVRINVFEAGGPFSVFAASNTEYYIKIWVTVDKVTPAKNTAEYRRHVAELSIAEALKNTARP